MTASALITKTLTIALRVTIVLATEALHINGYQSGFQPQLEPRRKPPSTTHSIAYNSDCKRALIQKSAI
ncbi:hypothetical protein M378DRAFT_161693 [Amanita muscaria Koide BX008]|uniref:Secreted protein n=1 Tax=Amanita muscaria (strain Koide BX008) TaxID=946122 RepID=A0A0C2XA86_AMAMK|nr:hypothetical protein M378DRAFT_161693 [Amanita muscaria Koide BX008]